MKHLGIVGVGLLGSAVASRLLARGFDVSGYDTRPELPNALAASGLRPAKTMADAIAATACSRRHRRPPC
jgi:3-hydroxyisobutyrate dehydrogenase